MVVFVFTGIKMQAVGRVAGLMVEEARREFRSDEGILHGRSEPDYARCIQISTIGAQRAMLAPSLIDVLAPVVTGIVLGVAGVIGLLVGGLACRFSLAIFLANSGGVAVSYSLVQGPARRRGRRPRRGFWRCQ